MNSGSFSAFCEAAPLEVWPGEPDDYVGDNWTPPMDDIYWVVVEVDVDRCVIVDSVNPEEQWPLEDDFKYEFESQDTFKNVPPGEYLVRVQKISWPHDEWTGEYDFECWYSNPFRLNSLV